MTLTLFFNDNQQSFVLGVKEVTDRNFIFDSPKQ